MENNRNNCPATAACEKIYRAITPARTRRLSNWNKQSSPAKVTNQRSKAREANEGVHIEFHSSNDKEKPAKSKQVNVQEPNGYLDKDEPAQKEWKITATEIADVRKVVPAAKPAQHVENRFTDYINRAGLKIRTASNAGSGKSTSTEVGGNKDHFTDFIRKAKMKIRTTSSLKKRSESFYNIEDDKA